MEPEVTSYPVKQVSLVEHDAFDMRSQGSADIAAVAGREKRINIVVCIS